MESVWRRDPGRLQSRSGRARGSALALALAAVSALVFVGCSFDLGPGGRAAQHEYQIPTNKSARTRADYLKLLTRHDLRTGPEAYRKVGVRNAKWDKPAEQFLKSYSTLGTRRRQEKYAALAAEGKALLARGCKDPLVTFCYGQALQELGRAKDAEPVLMRALSALEKSRYPKMWAAHAAFRIAEVNQKLVGEKDPLVAKYVRIGAQHLATSLSDGSFQDGEQPIFLEILDERWEGVLSGREMEVYRALQADPKADPYVVDTVGGRYHLAAAWQARGSDWASEVTREGWQSFGDHLASARELLTRAWKLRPEFPQAPRDMIQVAMGEAGEGEDGVVDWFNRAAAAQMDYGPAYRQLLWALRPRWGGSYEEMYEFGVACLDTARFDTDAPIYFARAVREITDDLQDDPAYWQAPETEQRLRTLFAGYEQAQPGNSWWYDSIHAGVEYRLRHPEKVREILDRLGGDLDPDFFTIYAGIDVDRARREVEAKPVNGP